MPIYQMSRRRRIGVILLNTQELPKGDRPHHSILNGKYEAKKMTMDRIEPTMYTRHKKLKKLIKLIEGQESAPANLKRDLTTRISMLSTDLGTDDLGELKRQLIDLNSKLGALGKPPCSDEFDIITETRPWYLRPLISHFDSPKKVKALASNEEGVGRLKTPVELFLPQEFWARKVEDVNSNLSLYFQFKSMGKGRSKSIEKKFYELFKITNRSPDQWSTIGKNKLPVLFYNLERFVKGLAAGKRSVIVTGLCPISGISNEVRVISRSDECWQPDLGFEPLPLPGDEFEVTGIRFPPRPILSDYIILKNFVQALDHFYKTTSRDQVSGLIWYPSAEYITDFSELVFSNWLEAGIITRSQLETEFEKIKTRYINLFAAVLKLEKCASEIEFRTTETDDLAEFESMVNKLDLGQITHLYGTWSGSESRLKLYLYLIIKHILPSMSGNDVLHLETSYELWPNVQGSKLVENAENAGTFAWICYPSTPSLSMSHMRDYNAPFDDKLYLAEHEDMFEQNVRNLSKNYIAYVAPQILEYEDIKKVDKIKLRTIFTERLIEINKSLTS